MLTFDKVGNAYPETAEELIEAILQFCGDRNPSDVKVICLDEAGYDTSVGIRVDGLNRILVF